MCAIGIIKWLLLLEMFCNVSAAGNTSKSLLSAAESGLCKLQDFFLNTEITTFGGIAVSSGAC